MTEKILKLSLFLLLLIPLLIFPLTDDMFVFPKSVFMVMICLFSVLLVTADIFIRGKIRVYDLSGFYLPFVLITACFIFSFFTGKIYSVSLPVLSDFICIMLYFMALIHFYRPDFNDKLWLMRTAATVSLVICLYGIVQTAGYDLFWNDFPDYLAEKRIFSTLGNKNFLSYFLALTLFSCFSLPGKLKYLILIPFTMIFWWMTRGAITAALVSAIYLFREKKSMIKKEYLLILLIPVIIFSLRFGKIRQLPKPAEIGRYSSSFVQRDLIWKSTIDLIAENPWGVGLGNFKNYYFISQGKIISRNKELAPYICDAVHAHNDFLEIISDFGVLNGAVLVSTIIYAAYKLGRIYSPAGAVFCGYAVAAMFSFPSYLPSTLLVILFSAFLAFCQIPEKSFELKLNLRRIITLLFITGFCLFQLFFHYRMLMGNITMNNAIQSGRSHDFMKSYKIFPASEKLCYEWGVRLVEKKLYRQAVPFLEYSSSVNFDPSRPYMLAQCWFNLEQSQLAEMYFNRTVELDPYHYHARSFLGQLKEKQGDREGASEQYRLMSEILKEKLWRQ